MIYKGLLIEGHPCWGFVYHFEASPQGKPPTVAYSYAWMLPGGSFRTHCEVELLEGVRRTGEIRAAADLKLTVGSEILVLQDTRRDGAHVLYEALAAPLVAGHPQRQPTRELPGSSPAAFQAARRLPSDPLELSRVAEALLLHDKRRAQILRIERGMDGAQVLGFPGEDAPRLIAHPESAARNVLEVIGEDAVYARWRISGTGCEAVLSVAETSARLESTLEARSRTFTLKSTMGGSIVVRSEGGAGDWELVVTVPTPGQREAPVRPRRPLSQLELALLLFSAVLMAEAR